jgi:hypothetical protein
MQFLDTTNFDGLINECERICLMGVTGISGDTTQLKNFTARINQALDRFYMIALTHDSQWQFDDTNYSDLPIGVGDLISGQQDYSFSSDVLTVEKVMIKDSSGNWQELDKVDINERGAAKLWTLATGNTGVPTRYDKFANSIFFDPIPNYNSTGGLKVVFKRNGSKFVYTDTTKQPGIPSLFHPYLARVASLPHLIEHNMDSLTSINSLILQDEQNIKDFMGRRNRDDKKRMRANVENTR